MINWAIANRVCRAIDGFNRRIGRLMVWPIFLAVVISAGNALSRKFFDLSSNAMLEIQWYLFSLAFMGSAGYVLMVNEHVRIDALSQRFSARARAWIDMAMLLFALIPLTWVLGSLGFDLFWRAWITGEMSSNAGGLPRWPVYLCIPVGMLLLGLQAVSETLRRAMWLSGASFHANATLKEADLVEFLPRHRSRLP